MSTAHNKVAIVTGAASGIGLALGNELARRGHHVILADINAAGAVQAAAELRQAGLKASAERLDVTNPQAVAQLIESTAAHLGRLDLLFNNAGIAIVGSARDLELKDWERLLDVNLWGVLHGVAAAYPLMIRQGFGHIVNTASVAGLVPAPTLVPYSMTKHAVVGLSISLRSEAAVHGVRVSVVCPGFIDTPLQEVSEYRSLDKDAVNRAIPFRGTAEHCARVIVRGVEKNKAIILVTGHARFLWWLHRIAPGLSLRFAEAQYRRTMRLCQPPKT